MPVWVRSPPPVVDLKGIDFVACLEFGDGAGKYALGQTILAAERSLFVRAR